MSKKQKEVCTTLNCIEHFLILGPTITGFASAIGLKICAITVGVKKYKSIIKKKKKKHDKLVLSAKSKLNSIEVLISKALIDSVISHDKFVLINNVLKECNEMKEEIKILKTLSVYQRF